MDLDVFSKRLEELMDLEGYSIRALSKEIGADRKSIRLWLSGRYYPKCKYLIKLSICFKVRIDYLLGLEATMEDVYYSKDVEVISMAEVQQSLSATLSAFMAEKSITKYKLAKDLKMDAKSMTKWLTSGSMPEVGKLIKLSQVMGLFIQKLLGLGYFD